VSNCPHAHGPNYDYYCHSNYAGCDFGFELATGHGQLENSKKKPTNKTASCACADLTMLYQAAPRHNVLVLMTDLHGNEIVIAIGN